MFRYMNGVGDRFWFLTIFRHRIGVGTRLRHINGYKSKFKKKKLNKTSNQSCLETADPQQEEINGKIDMAPARIKDMAIAPRISEKQNTLS